MSDDLFLNEELQKMENHYKNQLNKHFHSGFFPHDETEIIESITDTFFYKNILTPAISVNGLYSFVRAIYCEKHNLPKLYNLYFPIWLTNFLMHHEEFKLKHFEDSGWVILDLNGRTMARSYNTNHVPPEDFAMPVLP